MAWTRYRKLWLAIGLGISSVNVAAAQTTGTFLDQGGAIFNVRAYGATGNGTSDDSGAVQKTINAATAAGGGIVYFPGGNYLLSNTLNISSPAVVSLVGTGLSSTITVNTTVGVSLTGPVGEPFHTAEIGHMRFECNSGTQTAIEMTDIVAAPFLIDLTVERCNAGFDIVNQNYWTEGLVAVDITDDYNNHLFHYDQNPSDGNNSYGYGTYSSIHINKSAGQDVFYLTGGAYLYHSTFVVKGNFASNATGASIFNVQGATGQPCPGASFDTFDIAVEGGDYAVVNASDNGCSGGATGNALVSGLGSVSASGIDAGTTDMIKDIGSAAYLVGTLSTTASSSDTLTTPLASPGIQCYVEAGNGTAAQMLTGTYVSNINWGAVTITHPGTAGGLFQVWCQ